MSERPTDAETRAWRMHNHPSVRASSALREALEDRDAAWAASQTSPPRPDTCLLTAGAGSPVRFIRAAEYVARLRAREVSPS